MSINVSISLSSVEKHHSIGSKVQKVGFYDVAIFGDN